MRLYRPTSASTSTIATFPISLLLALLMSVPISVNAKDCNSPAEAPYDYDFNPRGDMFGENPNTPTDYYKLAINWSPDYCQKVLTDIETLTLKGREDLAQDLQTQSHFQCESGQGFGWVLHGLWGSSCNGKTLSECSDLKDIKKHPRFCKGDLPQVSYSILKPFMCMSPSAELLQGEWEKHGACDFKSPKAYFSQAEKLFSSIKLPNEKLEKPELDQWLKDHNKMLINSRLAFGKSEFYICYDKSFKIMDCPLRQ